MASETRYLTQAELAREADVEPAEIDELVAVGVLVRDPDARALLSPTDWEDAGTAELKGLPEPIGLARLR